MSRKLKAHIKRRKEFNKQLDDVISTTLELAKLGEIHGSNYIESVQRERGAFFIQKVMERAEKGMSRLEEKAHIPEPVG